MRALHNLSAGLTHSLIAVLAGLASVPFYIHYLGIEAYGLIGFYLTLQAFMQVLDLGLGPTISREIAQSAVAGTIERARDLLYSLSFIYWGTAVVIGGAVALLANVLATRWLNVGALNISAVVDAIILIGVIIACRWPSGLYLGALTGAHRLATASYVGIGLVLATNLGGVAVVALVSPTIQAFFLWQAVVCLGYALFLRRAAWRAVSGPNRPRFDLAGLKRIWRFSAAMGGVAVTAIIVSQLDKLILSNMLDLEMFGYYMLAVTVAGLLSRLIGPVFNVVYPRFSALDAAQQHDRFARLYRRGTSLFAALYFPASAGLVMAASPFIALWTGSTEVAIQTAPLITILAVGSALHGVMYFPYAAQVACGLVRLPLTINLVLAAVQVPLIIILASRFGAMGGAASWLALHALYLVLGTWLTHRHILRGLAVPWLVHDVGRSLFVSAVIGLAGWLIVPRIASSPVLQIVAATGFAGLACLLSFILSPYSRADLREALSE